MNKPRRPGKSRLPRKRKQTATPPVCALGEAVRSGFSDDEITEVLARLLLMLDPPTVARFAKSLGPERERVLRDVLSTANGLPAEKSRAKGLAHSPLGAGRALQEWKKAWADWDDIVAESNDEHGDYVHQEHHWEPPYFCPNDVADALEPIAARMRPLIPKLTESTAEPELDFLGMLEESLEDIGSGLEEWMGAWEGDGMMLGPNLTACLFEAQWAQVQKTKGDPAEVVARIQAFESTNRKASLDSRTAAEFLLALPRQELLHLVKSLDDGSTEKRSRWWQTVVAAVKKKEPAERGRPRRTVERRSL
ncbi:MAG: hypothetical protein HY303_12620 [Candidatus Wallbacteria bacterium]|nr:hypothetical protein [Candidatus Wallbacteria bacterium]